MEKAVVANIAEFISSVSLDDLNDRTKDGASRGLIDTIGVMLAGTSGDVSESLREFLASYGGSGNSSIVGWGLSVQPEIAALANGTLGHSLDFDDTIEMYPGHPSSVVIGALLASPFPSVLRGDELLLAYAVGIEVGAKIGAAVGVGHYVRGWHASSTVGIFAAVAGLSKLMGLSNEEIQQAFGIASSFVSGIRCNFGTMTKSLHSGWAAHSAIIATQLARVSWTANEEALDAHFGYMEVYGDEKSTTSELVSRLGKPYIFDKPGVALKYYPCYAGVHRAIDATRAAMADTQQFTWKDIESITCAVPPGRLKAVLYHQPATGLEGKFSYEYAIAAAIVDGTVELSSFTNEAVTRPEIVALYPTMTIQEEERCAGIPENSAQSVLGSGGFMEVTIIFRSGAKSTAAVVEAKGSPNNQFTWDEVISKFRNCAEVANVESDQIEYAASVLRHPETVEDVHAVLARLVVNADLPPKGN